MSNLDTMYNKKIINKDSVKKTSKVTSNNALSKVITTSNSTQKDKPYNLVISLIKEAEL